MTSTRHAHDKPDHGIVVLPVWLAMLIDAAFALMLWAVIWFAMTWTIGVLSP